MVAENGQAICDQMAPQMDHSSLESSNLVMNFKKQEKYGPNLSMCCVSQSPIVSRSPSVSRVLVCWGPSVSGCPSVSGVLVF